MLLARRRLPTSSDRGSITSAATDRPQTLSPSGKEWVRERILMMNSARRVKNEHSALSSKSKQLRFFTQSHAVTNIGEELFPRKREFVRYQRLVFLLVGPPDKCDSCLDRQCRDWAVVERLVPSQNVFWFSPYF